MKTVLPIVTHNSPHNRLKWEKGSCPYIYKELKYMRNVNFTEMTNFSILIWKSKPTYLYHVYGSIED